MAAQASGSGSSGSSRRRSCETARSEPDIDSRVTSRSSLESGLSAPGSFAEQSALLRRPLSRRERAASTGGAATAG
jgi:hypothetical protein